MKTLKTLLTLAVLAAIVIAILSAIMPKIAYNQKKALFDGYKIAKKLTDTDDTYIIRVNLSKGTWEDLEMQLDRDGWKPEAEAKYWKASPNKELFTAKEIQAFQKEYVRMSTKKLPIQQKYFVEYLAVMQDSEGVYLYFEVQMQDSEVTPCH